MAKRSPPKTGRPRTRARAPKSKPRDGYVTGTELAQRIGLSKQQVSNMAREDGAPFDAKGWRWPDAMHWFIRREKARGRPPISGETGVQGRTRLEAARAEMAELELARIRGETMTLQQFDRVISAAFSRVRARALTLPGKIAGEGEMRPREELLVVAEQYVLEMLEELAMADDVPHHIEDEVAA